MDELPHRLPQAGPSREEGEQQEMETSASATATASGLQSPPQRQSIQDKNNDDTLVQAAGDILYYVDAAGNPIDPDDMGDYALQQEGQQEQEGPTVDSSLLMEVDNEHLVELNEESRVPDHANGKALLQEQDETKTIPAGEEHEQEMDNNEIDKPDLQRYARPFIPPPKIDGVNQDSNQEALPPDYTVRYTITGHRKNVSCIRFSPNGEWLLTAGGFQPTVFSLMGCRS